MVLTCVQNKFKNELLLQSICLQNLQGIEPGDDL